MLAQPFDATDNSDPAAAPGQSCGSSAAATTVRVPAGTQVQLPVKPAGRVVIDADLLAAGAILKGQGISIEVPSREG